MTDSAACKAEAGVSPDQSAEQQHRMQQPGQHHGDARGVVALRQATAQHQVAHSHRQAQAQAGQGFMARIMGTV